MNERPQAILDTCVLVDILRGRKEDLSKKLQHIDLVKCAITDLTRFELLCGAEASREKDKNLQLVDEICSKFEIWPTSCGYEFAAKEKIRLNREGAKISDIDLLIGCLCCTENIPLVTGNFKHMERITGIKLIPW